MKGQVKALSIPLPPAVIIHDLAQARFALAPKLPVTLLSAPGAGSYLGCLWWRELLTLADFSGPSLLDCADAPGRALEALKLGLPGIVLTGPAQALPPLAAIAHGQGARLLTQPPSALNLAQFTAETRLIAWLGGMTGALA
ncbi:MAG: hypothetical protein B7X08_04100 [Acidocella sp. 20-63-7]|nr:MAG: hypothetical protein B7X08_04100 [Acidocella sp. 20-63-7]HQT46603.1 hypothetical protein [Acidocella sp.]